MFACASEPDGREVAIGTGVRVAGSGVRRDRIEISFPSETRHLPALRSFFRSLFVHARWANPPGRVLAELQLVLQEACVNAIRHASKRRADESITVAFILLTNGITIEVWDQGKGFDPADVPEPEAGSLQEGGYGVFIIEQFTDRVEVARRGKQFVLSMTRFFDVNGRDGNAEGR